MWFARQRDVRNCVGPLLLPTEKGRRKPFYRLAVLRAAVTQHPDALFLRPVGECCGAVVVGARDQHTAWRQSFDELVEDRAVGIRGTEEIQVVGLDVGHHRDVRRVLEQRAVALVGLGHETRAAAVMGVGARLAEVAADRERRVEPGVLQRHDEHRRRGGLACRARHHQRGVAIHQPGQHHGSQYHRDTAAPRLDELGVGLGDRGVRRHDGCRSAGQQVQRGFVVADVDDRTTRA